MKSIKLFAAIAACLLNALSIGAKTYNAEGTNRLRVSTCVCVGNMWAEKWNNNDFKAATVYSGDKFIITVYPRNDEVWNYYCKITINEFSIPDKKTIKAHQKNNKWLFYGDCDVEFFYNVEYPSIEECFANYGGFVVNAKDTSAKKRKVKGRVKVNPDFFTAGKEKKDVKKMDMAINCYFDEVGYAVDFTDLLLFK